MKNRHNQRLAVVTEVAPNARGLVFVVHGLGGFKEQIHIKAMAQAFLDEGFTTVTYDAANTIGESGGNMEEATLTNYFEDLEDVVAWAKKQSWFITPFVVSGHSLGGACSIMFAARNPGEIMAIAPVCPFIAGALYESHQDPNLVTLWEKQGYINEPSQSKPGVVKRLNWSLAEDLRTHDVRTIADQVTCPSLIIAGSKDDGIPEDDIRQVVDRVNGPVQFEVIQGMGHNPREPEHIDQLSSLIQAWAKKL